MKVGRGPRGRWRIKMAELEGWEQQQRVCYDGALREEDAR